VRRTASYPTTQAKTSNHLDVPVAAGLSVLIVDDQALMRSALRLLLETSLGHRVVEAASADEALEAVTYGSFDVVLLDVRMPGHDGLWTLGEIHRLRPGLPIVMLSYFADRLCVRKALDAGAAGYLVKGAEVYQVMDSISTAIAGTGVYLHPLAAACVVSGPSDGAFDQLTVRERDVLRLLVEGATNDEIARRLFITEKTVKTHISGVFRKLGVTNRTQAATKALKERILIDDPA
jgi:DNA-binding NarL/FixJ family response regulator